MSPSGTGVLVDSTIEIEFSEPMVRESVEENFRVEPGVSGWFEWQGQERLVFHPQSFAYGTEYTVVVERGAKAAESGFVAEKVEKKFKTVGEVAVVHVEPFDQWRGVDVESEIRVRFDQEVVKESAEVKVTVVPEVEGEFVWEDEELVFAPREPFEFGREYEVMIDSGIEGVAGLTSRRAYRVRFRTQDEQVRLVVATHLQERPLSCEVAALVMALAYRGQEVREDDLLAEVGVDWTPNRGGVWGNPHKAFVGNVNGRQMRDGYGVYWGPIARVARVYRPVKEFEDWGVDQLTEQLALGNPVLIWVYSRGGVPTKWRTIEGEEIHAVSGEHVVTAVGFLGPSSDPTHVIVNDPLVGQVYWSREVFERKWKAFNGSGVVVL
jgi:uncharacterized protein YvpB